MEILEQEDSIIHTLRHRWWVSALRGVFAIALGFAAFLWPGPTISALVIVWGAYAFVDGIAAVIFGAATRWWSMLAIGLIGMAAGVSTFVRPDVTAYALLFVIAAWTVVRGVVDVMTAVDLRKAIPNEMSLITGGILSIVFGAVVVIFPSVGVLSLVWLLGMYALVEGVMLVSLAFRLRRVDRLVEAHV